MDTSNDIIPFLIGWYGKPNYQFEYFITNKNHKIEILVYLPVPAEGIDSSMIITSGFSSLDVKIEEDPIECIFEISEELTATEYEKLGLELVKQFHECIPFVHNKNCIPIDLSMYPELSGSILLNYGKHEAYFWETNPKVKVFEFIPLHNQEVTLLSMQPSEINNAIIFRSNGIDWTNWKRSEINIIKEAVSGVWNMIIKWYTKNAEKRVSQLKSAASQKSVARLNNLVKNLLPEDYVASLLLYNGEVNFHDYQYLSVNQVIDIVEMMKKLLKTNAFPSKLPDGKVFEQVKSVWWNEYWIPFAKDGGGNLMCIDLDPESSGCLGQIIFWEKNEGPIPTQYKSFFHWLFAYEQALYSGYYKVDKEGFIYY